MSDEALRALERAWELFDDDLALLAPLRLSRLTLRRSAHLTASAVERARALWPDARVVFEPAGPGGARVSGHERDIHGCGRCRDALRPAGAWDLHRWDLRCAACGLTFEHECECVDCLEHGQRAVELEFVV